MNDILKEIQKNDNFYLGGSRKMNELYPDEIKINNSTDYDYYCSNDIDNLRLLSELGFKKVITRDASYFDDLLIDIYKSSYDDTEIEVLIRSDVRVYSDAFKTITPYVYKNYLWKSSPVIIINNVGEFKSKVQDYFNALFRLCY